MICICYKNNERNCLDPFFAKQNNVSAHHFNEVGVKDFACKIQLGVRSEKWTKRCVRDFSSGFQGTVRNFLTRRMLCEIGTRHEVFSTKWLKI